MFKLKLNIKELKVQVSPSRYERGIIEEPPPNKISLVFIV
jgi:hypothetical protein